MATVAAGMRIFAKYRGQTYAIPCRDPAASSVGSLVQEVLTRCNAEQSKLDESRYALCLNSSGAILSVKDTVKDVLRDGDFVTLSECMNCVKLYSMHGIISV